MRALGKRLILQREALDQQTPSGFIFPEKYQDRAKVVGTVLAVGEEINSIKPGDRVVFHPPSCLGLMLDGIEYIFIHVDGILGVL